MKISSKRSVSGTPKSDLSNSGLSRFATFAIFFAGTIGVSLAQPAPPNDNFANATLLIASPDSVVGSNVSATKEPGEPNHAGNLGGRSVWWKWTAPGAGSVAISTAGSSFDTLLGVYTGAAVSGLTTVAANDNEVPGIITSRVNFNVASGATYWIAVDGFNDGFSGAATGTIVLSLLYSPRSVNDNLADATTLAGNALRVTRSNEGMTLEPGEPLHAGNPGGRSVWWTWTAPSSGGVALSTAGSDFNTLLAVYTGSSISNLTAVAANDDEVPEIQTSRVNYNAAAGTTYRIAVDGHGDGNSSPAFGNIVLTLTNRPTFVNDNFADTFPLVGTALSVTGSNVGATKEPDEPDHAGNPGGRSVWWNWTAPGDGSVVISTAGSGFGTLLAVYIGTTLSSLTTVATNGSGLAAGQVSFDVAGGTRYEIAVDGYNDGTGPVSGNIVLTLSYSASVINVNRIWIGGVSDDWFEPGNWIPPGVPAAGDTVRLGSDVNLSSPVTIFTRLDWEGGTIRGEPLTIAATGLLNIENSPGLETALTNAGTVIWTGGDLAIGNNSGNGSSYIENLTGALWNIEGAFGTIYDCCSSGAYFQNDGEVRQSIGSAAIGVQFNNAGTLAVLHGNLAFSLPNGFDATGGTLRFGMSHTNDFGSISVTNDMVIDGELSVVWLGGFAPALSNSFPLLAYGSYSGAFSSFDLPAAAQWQTLYSPTAFSVAIGDIQKLAFVGTPPATTAGSLLPLVVVQVVDSVTGILVPTSGVPVTLAVSGSTGALSGTLTRTTDANGRASFNDLRISLAGDEALQASAPGMTPADSATFTVAPAAPAQLGFVAPIVSPQTAAGQFTPAPTVEVLDGFGNVIPSSMVSVTAGVASGGGGTLAGITNELANDYAVFDNLVYNLAQAGIPERVIFYFSSPGLASVTNLPVFVEPLFPQITLRDGNSVLQIDPTTERGVFSWTVDGVGQVYQQWFWVAIGSNAAPVSIDALSDPWIVSAIASNAVIKYLGPAANVTAGYSLTGGAPGSHTSELAVNVLVQNVTNMPLDFRLYEYADFDLGGAAAGDLLSFPSGNSVVQGGKGMALTQTIQSAAPGFWEGAPYPATLNKLDGTLPLTLSDVLTSSPSGDETFAYEWAFSLAAGQTFTLNLTQGLRPVAIRLGIALSAGQIVIAWPTNEATGLQLWSSPAVGQGGAWGPVTNVPRTTNGLYEVAVPLSGRQQFFRLQ